MLLWGAQELVKLRAMRLGPGAAQRPAAPEDDDEWSTVGRRGAKTTTRGDECLAVRPPSCFATIVMGLATYRHAHGLTFDILASRHLYCLCQGSII